MDHHTEQTTPELTPALNALLDELREADRFSAAQYARRKAERLNEYLTTSNLKSCVLGVSGGIDSAVTLALIVEAARLPRSPIRRIVPALLPVQDERSATHQSETIERGREVCAALKVSPVLIDLSAAHATLKRTVDEALEQQGQGWASGQLVAYQRTPALYYLTSLLREAGTPGLVVGTTNRDEGAYLGYFGKASDGMVDLQLISDIHKSQVLALGEHFRIPQSVLKAEPTGDMFDGRSDQEVFGASYDAVELFLRVKARHLLKERIDALAAADRERFDLLAGRLEALHRFNHHKYLGKSPAVHLDLWGFQIPQGWDYYTYTGSTHVRQSL